MGEESHAVAVQRMWSWCAYLCDAAVQNLRVYGRLLVLGSVLTLFLFGIASLTHAGACGATAHSGQMDWLNFAYIDWLPINGRLLFWLPAKLNISGWLYWADNVWQNPPREKISRETMRRWICDVPS